MVSPLINTPPGTTVTEDDIEFSPIPLLVSDDAITFTDHANNLQTHLTSTTTMKNRNKCKPKFNFPVVQAKQYTVDNYYLFIDKLITTRYIHLIFNQSQAEAQQLSIQRRREVYLGACNYYLQTFHPLSNPERYVIQYQDALNNILIIIWSDGLFKVLFRKYFL